MSHSFNMALQYSASCVLLGGWSGAARSGLVNQVPCSAQQCIATAKRHAPSVAGGINQEMCALLRPPRTSVQRGVKRVLMALMRTVTLLQAILHREVIW